MFPNAMFGDDFWGTDYWGPAGAADPVWNAANEVSISVRVPGYDPFVRADTNLTPAIAEIVRTTASTWPSAGSCPQDLRAAIAANVILASSYTPGTWPS